MQIKTNLAKLFLTGILLIPAAILVFSHNLFNLLRGGGISFFKSDFKNVIEVKQSIYANLKLTTIMDSTEIAIWIVIPSILMTLTFLLWKRRLSILQRLFPVIIFFFALSLTAQFTNNLGVEEQSKKQLTHLEKEFEFIKYPGVDLYTIDFDTSLNIDKLSNYIRFTTQDDLSSVQTFYERKGVKITSQGEDAVGMKKPSPDYNSISIYSFGTGTEVHYTFGLAGVH